MPELCCKPAEGRSFVNMSVSSAAGPERDGKAAAGPLVRQLVCMKVYAVLHVARPAWVATCAPAWALFCYTGAYRIFRTWNQHRRVRPLGSIGALVLTKWAYEHCTASGTACFTSAARATAAGRAGRRRCGPAACFPFDGAAHPPAGVHPRGASHTQH